MTGRASAWLLLSLSAWAGCGGVVGSTAAGGADGADGAVDGPESTADLEADCAEVCAFENASPSCRFAATCNGACPDTCMTVCLAYPGTRPACDQTYSAFTHCLAKKRPFFGCLPDGGILTTWCEPEIAAWSACEYAPQP